MHGRRFHGLPAGTDRAAARGTPTRRRSRSAGGLAAVMMALAACAGVDEPGSVAAPSEPADAPTPSEAPGDGDLPLLRLHHAGGFLPLGWDFARVPELTVYPDGRAVTHGPQIAIHPPPVLPNLVLRDLTEADVDALVTAARDAGLLADGAAGYGRPNVADAGTTFLTLQVDGRALEHAAEALSVVDGVEGFTPGPGADPGVADLGEHPPEAPSPQSAAAWGLTEEELTARAGLATFIARARELVGAAQELGPYAVERFAVMARPAPDLPAGEEPEAELVPQVVPWPLDVPLADAQDCVLVDGEDARTLRDALLPAAFTVQFEQAGTRYEAWFRPLLPHETGCDDV